MRKSRYLKIAAQSAQNASVPRKGPERGHLVLVDAGPIRAFATTRYRQTKEKFTEAQALLARFQEKDKPKFERWLQEKFRDLVTDLRSAQGELNRLRELIFEVETRTWFNNQSCAAAYRDVLERKARRREHPEEPPAPDDLEEKMRAHLEAEARDAQEEEAEARAGAVAGAVHRRHLTPDKEARLKAAYRAMARRLHPDRNRDGKITPQMRERWHEAQQAYLAGDVDLLESIESMCADEEGEVSLDTPVSLILERTVRLVASLTQLANKMVHHKKEPAWAFSVLKDLTKIERIMAKTLPGQVKSARTEIAELEEKISQWKADAERFYPGFKEKHEEHHAEEHAKKTSAKASASSAKGAPKEKDKPKAHAFAKSAKPAPKAAPAKAKGKTAPAAKARR